MLSSEVKKIDSNSIVTRSKLFGCDPLLEKIIKQDRIAQRVQEKIEKKAITQYHEDKEEQERLQKEEEKKRAAELKTALKLAKEKIISTKKPSQKTIAQRQKAKKEDAETSDVRISKREAEKDIIKANLCIEYLRYLFLRESISDKEIGETNEATGEIIAGSIGSYRTAEVEKLNSFLTVIYAKTGRGRIRKQNFIDNVGEDIFNELDYWYYPQTQDYYDSLLAMRCIVYMQINGVRPSREMQLGKWLPRIFTNNKSGEVRRAHFIKNAGQDLFDELEAAFEKTSLQSKLTVKLIDARERLITQDPESTLSKDTRAYLLMTIRRNKTVLKHVEESTGKLVGEVSSLIKTKT
jgi:hypothetical protein